MRKSPLSWTDSWLASEPSRLTILQTIRRSLASVISFPPSLSNTAYSLPFLQTLEGHDIPAMIAAFYEHKISAPADVIKALQISSPSGEPDPALPYFRRLIRQLVVRYLNGAGHPVSMCGRFISEDDFVRQQGSHVLRPSLFLLAATNSDLPSGDRDWYIVVRT